MFDANRITRFRFWCQKVLPLVYDDSLSYYEVLCKVVEYLNKAFEGFEVTTEEVEKLAGDIDELRAIVNKLLGGDFSFIQEIIGNAIDNVFFGLTDNGYFVAYIPESWDDIIFNTTGWDIDLAEMPQYGHLVLSY